MNFKRATDLLFDGVSHPDLAKAMDVSVASIRQARLDETAKAHRSPPAGWEKAVATLAEARAERLAALADRLKRSS